MNLSHKIRLDPTNKQRTALQKAAGCARYAWNCAVAAWNKKYEETKKTPKIKDLKRQFNKEKPDWIYESPKDANQQPFAFLQKAWSRRFDYLKQNALYKSKKTPVKPMFVGEPTFHKKGECKDSFYVANDQFALENQKIHVAHVGWLRMREPLRLQGKILSATFSREADGWYVSFSVDGEFSRKRTGESVVGVDLGIRAAYALSTGEIIKGPRPLKKYSRKTARLQRKFSRQQKGSKRREKQAKRIARLHKRIRDVRHDFIHKITDRLCRENQAVVIEDLHVKGMLRNHRLAKAISDMGFGEFRRQLQYKAALYGTEVIVADRWFPSSKTCHACGAIKETLALSERVFCCEHCGYVEDRDVNAAKNLRALGLRAPARGLDIRPALPAVEAETRTNRQRRARLAVVSVG